MAASACVIASPLVDVITGGGEIITYGHVDPKKVPRIIEEHVINGKPVEEWVVKRDRWENGERKTWDVDGYFARQRKIVLENSGYIDPENIDEYIAVGGVTRRSGRPWRWSPRR